MQHAQQAAGRSTHARTHARLLAAGPGRKHSLLCCAASCCAVCTAVNVYLPKDRVTNMHQGYGFVEFKGEEDADYVSMEGAAEQR